MSITQDPADVVVREGTYGDRVVAVEPGGAEFIPLAERHGVPRQLFWTWVSPNLEFATIFVGVLAVMAFSLPFWGAVLGIVVGSALGSLTHGLLSSRGPSAGVPMMVLSRLGFGFRGNALPAGLNAVVGGIGWFAVNSVSGALALATLTGMPAWLGLLLVAAIQIAVALLGHNLIHRFEKVVLPVLAVVFAITSVVILTQVDPGFVPTDGSRTARSPGSSSRSGRPSATPRAGTPTPPTTPATSRRRRAAGPSGGPPGSASSSPAWSSRSWAPPRRRWCPTRTRAPPPPSPRTCRGCWRGSPCSASPSARSPPTRSTSTPAPCPSSPSASACPAAAPRARRRRLRGPGLPARPLRTAGRGRGLRGIPADHRLLDRPVARRRVRRLVPAPRHRPRGAALRHPPRQRGRRGRDARGIVVSILLFANQVAFTGLVAQVVPQVGDIAFEVGFVVSAGVYLLWRGRSRTT